MSSRLDIEEEQQSWKRLASCASGDVDPAVFFSEDLGDIATAKSICAGCEVLTPCLQGALEREEPCGVWGGQLFLGGRMLTVKRRRGRPPKVPRPEDRLPVVPIPAEVRVPVAS